MTDTHTAVAYKVYEDYVAETGDKTPTVIASTASAYKFAESVAKAIGLDENKVKILTKAGEKVTGFDYVKALAMETEVKVPSGLKDLELKPVVHNNVCEKTEMPEVVLGAL